MGSIPVEYLVPYLIHIIDIHTLYDIYHSPGSEQKPGPLCRVRAPGVGEEEEDFSLQGFFCRFSSNCCVAIVMVFGISLHSAGGTAKIFFIFYFFIQNWCINDLSGC